MADAVLIDDVLDYLNMDTPTAEEQAELTQYISAAVSVVEMYCGPIIAREVVDWDVTGLDTLVLRHRPVVELVSLVDIGGTAVDPATVRVSRDIGWLRLAGGGRFPAGPFDVTYRAGWAETIADVPPALALACQVIVAHLFGDQRRPTLGPQPEFRDDIVDASTVSSGFAIPYKARDLMAPYRMATTVLMP